VPFEDLPALYQSADLFIYPSRFEGFGIPIIEAIHSGLPVIAATGSCLEEAGGPNSLYISPDDDESLAQAIYKILHDDHLREQMISQGIQYVERFDDKVIADGIIEVYQNVMR
jgi:glycosyltransferase involved in cell wall biosynthesis